LPGYEYPVPEIPFTLPPKTTTPPTTPKPLITEEIDYDDYDPNDIPEDQSAPAPECVPAEDQDTATNQGFILAGVPICPSEEPKGYEYPVPEIPFTLPTKEPTSPTTSQPVPECVDEEEKDTGPNPQYLLDGIPICPPDDIPSYKPSTAPPSISYDDYDPSDIPSDQAEPLPDCVPAEEKEDGSNPKYIAAGVPLCSSDEPEGYSYPVPENPLLLPQRKRKSKTLFQGSTEVPVTKSGISITDIGRVISFHVPKLNNHIAKTKKKVKSDALLDATILLSTPKKDMSSMSAASMGQHDSASPLSNKVKNGHKKMKNSNKKHKKNKHNKNKNKNKNKKQSTTIKPTKESKKHNIQIQPSKPRTGKNVSAPRKGKKAISVEAWLRRGK